MRGSQIQETEFLQTGVAKAFDAWTMSFNDVLELVGAVPSAFKVVVESIRRPNRKLLNDVLGWYQAGMTYEAAERSLDNGNETLHVLCLLASWAAFGSFVEETTTAIIRAEPKLISTKAFEKARRKTKQFEDPERLERIIEAVVPNQRGKLDTEDNGRYENQLGLVGLNGPVPRDLALALMEAEQVRDAWAQNNGKAGTKLIEHCPNIGISLGDKVALTKLQLAKYLLALDTYATIILNRFRVDCGLPPLDCDESEANIFKESFNVLFPDAVPADELFRTLKAERDADSL